VGALRVSVRLLRVEQLDVLVEMFLHQRFGVWKRFR
jgi:hypothetical protein